MTIGRDLEPVVLWEDRIFFVTTGLRQRSLMLLVMHVGDALKEQQWENVGFEIGCIDRTAKDIGRLPQVRFKLLQTWLISHFLDVISVFMQLHNSDLCSEKSEINWGQDS